MEYDQNKFQRITHKDIKEAGENLVKGFQDGLENFNFEDSPTAVSKQIIDDINYFNEAIHREYIGWLCSLVGVPKSVFDYDYGRNRYYRYRAMAEILSRISYYYINERDANRADDGVELRERWVNECLNGGKDLKKEIMDDLHKVLNRNPCSVLEMMVALAIRCEENIMYKPSAGNRTGQWFVMMINNLGLGNCTDEVITSDDQAVIIGKVTDAMDCKYDYNGNGGFFPLKNPSQDQRNVELWYQMCAFINENGIE